MVGKDAKPEPGNEAFYFSKDTQYPELKGLDLKIDDKIQKICEVSNASSSSSRGVLYVILISCIISIIAVVNTLPEKMFLFNWSSERENSARDSLNIYTHEIDSLRKFNTPNWQTDSASLLRRKDLVETNLKAFYNGNYQNVQTVHIPIVGNSFDVNDLSVIAGISLIILLGVLLVTTKREKYNLRIALHAITERYPDEYLDKSSEAFDVLPDFLCKELTDNAIEDPNTEGNATATIAPGADKPAAEDNIGKVKFNPAKVGYTRAFVRQFNSTRRRYHYNFLSMNEVFTLPESPLNRRSPTSFRNSLLGKIISNHLFHFPFWIYLLIVVNDFLSVASRVPLSTKHSIVQYSFSLLVLNAIAYLCYVCTMEKKSVQDCYDTFINDNYQFTFEATPVPVSGNVILNYTVFYTLRTLKILVSWMKKKPENAERA